MKETTADDTAVTIIGTVRDAWVRELQQHQGVRRTDPRDYVYASSRQRCVRRMALDLLHPGDWDPFTEDALERMRKGNEREDDIVARLLRVAKFADEQFEVERQQERFEIRDRDGTLLIVGKIDGMLRFPRMKVQVPFEIKSGQSFQRITRVEQFNDSVWTWNKLDQLLIYQYANGCDWGMFVLDKPGVPELIPVHLHDWLDRVEQFLQDARWAVDARFGKSDLPMHTDDRSLCNICPHLHKTCTPTDYDSGEGVVIITDEELIQAAERHEELADGAAEYKRLHDKLSKAMKPVPVLDGLLGPFRVSGKQSASTSFKVPKEIRDQYKEVNPTGTYKFTLTRVDDDDKEEKAG